jgi:hypothetical protein
MRRYVAHGPAVLIAALLLGSAAGPARAEANINFLLGAKYLDENDWGDASEQGAFGIQTTFGPSDWPVGIAIDAFGSAWHDEVHLFSEDISLDLVRVTAELDVGVRRIWKAGKARPFIGGGLAIISASSEQAIGSLSVENDDSTPGVWLDGGIFWRLGKRFNIGMDARLARAEVQLFGQDVQAGGFTFGLLLGWGWGGQGSADGQP